MRKLLIGGMLCLLAAAGMFAGCSKANVDGETIATVDGDVIKVRELREFLGVRGVGAEAPEVPVEQKRAALDRLIAGRLLAREAKAMALDNTVEYRSVVKENEEAVLISALFQKEAAARIKISKSEVEAEAKKLKAADNTVSDDNANLRARRVVSEGGMRKLEENLVAEATKKTPTTVNQAELDKLAKGGQLPDQTVLGTVGEAKITYGEVKDLLKRVSGGTHGAQDLSRNAIAIRRMLDHEATRRALVALAKAQGIQGSEWEKMARQNLERSVLIDMLAQREIGKQVGVSDKEIAEAYSQHSQMFVQDGKKIPLVQVKEQIRAYLQNDKRKKALESYIDELKKKAKITVREELLSKV